MTHSSTGFRQFIVDRFDTKTHLGRHLTLALVIGCAALWAFRTVLDAVLADAAVVRLDIAANEWIHAHVTPAGLAFFDIVSFVGAPETMVAIAVVVGLVLLRQRRRNALIAWVAAFVGCGILERALKLAVHRSRPVFFGADQKFDPYSFPSGHSMWSFIGIGMLMYILGLYWHPRRPWRRLVMLLGAALIFLIGASRVYLGVHYPSDVVGAWAATAAWMGVCASGLAVALHRRQISSS